MQSDPFRLELGGPQASKIPPIPPYVQSATPVSCQPPVQAHSPIHTMLLTPPLSLLGSHVPLRKPLLCSTSHAHLSPLLVHALFTSGVAPCAPLLTLNLQEREHLIHLKGSGAASAWDNTLSSIILFPQHIPLSSSALLPLHYPRLWMLSQGTLQCSFRESKAVTVWEVGRGENLVSGSLSEFECLWTSLS